MRYTLHRGSASVEAACRALGLASRPAPQEPDFNVAPTRRVPVLARGSAGKPEVVGMHWGLLPFYEEQRYPARLLPNARAETVSRLPAFRESFAKRRCLVPADGFYEWRKEGGRRIPHLFTLSRGRPLVFAGIWQRDGEGGEPGFALLTTTANRVVARLHDRMPVILQPGDLGSWLGEEALDPRIFGRLVSPLGDGELEDRELDTFVNSTRNNGPDCHRPPRAGGEGQLDLFA